MKHLLLSLGSRKCTLTANELQQFPHSFFAKLASCEDASDAVDEEVVAATESGNGSITLNLDLLSASPFSSWPEALDVVTALYRDKTVPVGLVDHMLGLGGTSTATAEHNSSSRSLYNRLASLLLFLGFTGSVSEWIPIKDIELRESRALDFSYACMAEDAAALMLRFKPHMAALSGFEWSNIAAFLVTTSDEKPGLNVQLLRTNSPGKLQAAVATAVSEYKQHKTGSVWGTDVVVTTSSDSITVNATHTQPLPVADGPKFLLQEKTKGALLKSAIGPLAMSAQANHPRLGRHLAEALQARCIAGLSVAACNVAVIDTSSYGAGSVSTLPLWVLQWGA